MKVAASSVFRSNALKVHSIEKRFVYMMMGFGNRDRDEAVRAESARGEAAPQAFAWTMHRFGFHLSP